MLALVLAVRFTLELVLLAVFAWWGFTLGGWPVAILTAIGVAVLWGLLLSPKARVALPPPVRNTVEVLVFVVAGAALTSDGHAMWAVLLVAADVLILIALRRLGADRDMR